MATLGIEIHQQVFLQFLLNTRLRTVDDVLLRVVTGRVWALIAMVAVGAAVYAVELLVTKDPMLKLGMDVVRRRKTEI